VGGLISYIPNYSMETPKWAGYYHIYLIIVWRPHSGILSLGKYDNNPPTVGSPYYNEVNMIITRPLWGLHTIIR
jgi:hypothetical protein